jgi:CheW-like domain
MNRSKPALISVVDYQIYLQDKLNHADQALRVEYLEFSVAKYRFLIDISFVQHVINWQSPYKMAFLPEYALGVIHEQQKAMVLVSLEKWLFGENLHHEQYPLILCCGYENFKVAFAFNQAAFYFHDQNQNDIYLDCEYSTIHAYLEKQKEMQKVVHQKLQVDKKNLAFDNSTPHSSEIWVINQSWFQSYLRF